MVAPAIVLYDGDCAFCSRGVQFIYHRDPQGRFRFKAGAPADTLVLLDGDRRFERSTAVLRIARRLRWPWSWLGALGLVVPRPLRDVAYDAVARRRHRLLRGEACPVPPPGLRERILD